MFAVKKIIEDKLYATELPGGNDTFTQCFIKWQDALYVREYLKSKPATQEFYHVGLKEATKIILRESKHLFEKIYEIVKEEKEPAALDELFSPLHKNDDFDLQHVPAKAYGTGKAKSFLRLYAIRFSDGCYLVIGGLIKMHPALQDSEEGKQILEEFRTWSDFLRRNNIEGAFELVTLINET